MGLHETFVLVLGKTLQVMKNLVAILGPRPVFILHRVPTYMDLCVRTDIFSLGSFCSKTRMKTSMKAKIKRSKKRLLTKNLCQNIWIYVSEPTFFSRQFQNITIYFNQGCYDKK